MYFNLRVARLKHRESQEDIAKLLGINVNTYSLKEQGKQDFKLKEAKKLADHYGMTVDALFFAGEEHSFGTYNS